MPEDSNQFFEIYLWVPEHWLNEFLLDATLGDQGFFVSNLCNGASDSRSREINAKKNGTY